MRDPARIDKIMTWITMYWKANPDQRFFQVLTSVGIYTPCKNCDRFYEEDSDLFKL